VAQMQPPGGRVAGQNAGLARRGRSGSHGRQG
jgi:hypothetical protein